jgi:hypothetical protein
MIWSPPAWPGLGQLKQKCLTQWQQLRCCWGTSCGWARGQQCSWCREGCWVQHPHTGSSSSAVASSSGGLAGPGWLASIMAVPFVTTKGLCTCGINHEPTSNLFKMKPPRFL